jgi:hypothetical protein
VRRGSQAPKGNCSITNSRSRIRLTEPQDEQVTVNGPRGGNGSFAVAVDVATSGSPAGVAEE